MLKNFFELNGTPEVVDTQEALLQRLRTLALRDTVYTALEFAPLGSDSRLSDCTISNSMFKRTVIRKVVFARCRFEDCLFLGTQFVSCEFHECVFVGCNLHHSTFQDTYIDPSIFEHAFDRKKHSNIGAWVFQALMRNAEQTRQRAFAATAEYNFLKWKRYQLNHERRTNRIGTWRWFQAWLPNVAYFAFAGYGLRPSFFVFWTAISITCTWLANMRWWPVLGMIHHGKPKPSVTPIEALYFSVVTVTTLGYGDLTPTTPLGMVVATIEVLFGVFLLGVFVAIVVRKLVR